MQGLSHVGTIDAGEETKEDDVGGREETPHTRSPAISTPQDGLTTQEPEAVPLVVPAALFRPHSYHPMHIFVSIVITYTILYNNKINARVLIGQSAMVYCAGKPMENRASSESLYKSNRLQVSMVYRLINNLGCW